MMHRHGSLEILENMTQFKHVVIDRQDNCRATPLHIAAGYGVSFKFHNVKFEYVCKLNDDNIIISMFH